MEHPFLAILGVLNFFKPSWCKKMEEIWNSQNWAFQIFSNHFGAKKIEKIRNGQNWAPLGTILVQKV